MSDESARDEEPRKLTIERYAVIQAHVRHFGLLVTDELLTRLEVDAVRWASDSAAWSTALLQEAEADGEPVLALQFARPYRETLEMLRNEKPALSSIGKAPPLPPAVETPPAPLVDEPPKAPVRQPETPSFMLEETTTEETVPEVAMIPVLLEGSTVPIAGDEPIAPSTPFASANPDESGFSLPQYAKLCAELVRATDRHPVLERHGLDKSKHEALDKHWRARIRDDKKLATAFERAYGDQLVELERMAAREKIEVNMPVRPDKPGKTATLPVGYELPVPPAAAAPKLTLDQHAALCAEVALAREPLPAILARWSIRPDEKDADDAHFRKLVGTDREVNRQWQAAFENARTAILARSGASR